MADLLSSAGEMVFVLAAIASQIAVVVLVGAFVSALGGPARDGSPAPRRAPPVIFGALALAFGAYVGVSHAWQSSVPGYGFSAFLSTWITVILIGGGASYLALIGGVALAMRRLRGSTATRTTFAGAGGLVAGALAGIVLAPVLGLTWRAPVVIERPAAIELTLPSEATFERRTGSNGTCMSVPDSNDVESIQGLDVGRLGEAMAIVNIYLPLPGDDTVHVDVILDGTLPPGANQPWWMGSTTVVDLEPDRSRGRVTFSALPLVGKEGDTPPYEWAGAISGEIAWECDGARHAPAEGT